jgi:leader peptidase (prepilin peptidase) / N-methyltransferase
VMRGVLPANGPLASLALSRSKATTALCVGIGAAVTGALFGPPEAALAGSILAFGLAWATMVDIDRFILPDVLTLGLVLVGLSLALRDGVTAAQPYVIGAIGGYLALALLAAGYQRFRGRSGLGMGDAKLLAAAGAWLGWTMLPLVLLLSSVGCLAFVATRAVMSRQHMPAGPIPFGPYLAGSIWILWLFQIGGGV